jgi:hypothetical protein
MRWSRCVTLEYVLLQLLGGIVCMVDFLHRLDVIACWVYLLHALVSIACLVHPLYSLLVAACEGDYLDSPALFLPPPLKRTSSALNVLRQIEPYYIYTHPTRQKADANSKCALMMYREKHNGNFLACRNQSLALVKKITGYIHSYLQEHSIHDRRYRFPKRH